MNPVDPNTGLPTGGNATPTTPTDSTTSSTPSLSNIINAFAQPPSQPLDVAGPTSTQPSSDVSPPAPVSFTQPSLTLPQVTQPSMVDFAQPTPSTSTAPSLASLLSPDLTSTLTGGTGAETSPSYDPAIYQPGGLFSPTATTGQIPSTADVAQALDPSRQVPTAQEQQQQPEPAQTPQPQPQQPEPQQPQGLPQLARSAAGGASDQGPQPQIPQRTAPPAVDQTAPAAPAPAAAPPPAAQRQPSGGGGAPRPPPAPTGGGPSLLQAILGLLGVPMQPSLSTTAQQAYPQRPFMPQAATARLGPYARARASGQPGKYQQPSQQEWERNMRGLGPAPGQSGAVTAPTQQQVQQSRMRGNFTQATAGFSPVLAQERAKFANELNNPRTRWETLAMIALEMEEDPAAVAESLLNRSDYAKTSIHNMLHSGFYGPVNFGKLAGEIRRLQANPERAAKINAGLETALRGSNLIGGATDQGSGRDPNVNHGGANIRYNEVYNDWGGGPGGHTGAELYRQRQQMRVRAGMHQADMGQQFAMDITRRIPMTGGAEMEATGSMIRRGEVESITEQRRKRERERARAGIVS